MLVHVRFVGAAETAAPPELAFVHSVGEHALFARLLQFLLWQAAKPSGDSCPPLMDNLWVENKKNGIKWNCCFDFFCIFAEDRLHLSITFKQA